MDSKALKNKIKEVEEKMEHLTLENQTKDDTIHQQKDKIDQLLVSNKKIEESNQRLEEYVRSLGISLEEVKDQNNELLDSNKGLEKQNRKIQRQLGIAVEDRAPMPEDESKRERFVLLKLNNSEYYPYYTIRAQNTYTDRKIKTKRDHFPNLEVLIDFKCNPNSKTLYNRIKEKLKETGVTFSGNSIDLEDTTITEDKLVEEMMTINDSKRNV